MCIKPGRDVYMMIGLSFSLSAAAALLMQIAFRSFLFTCALPVLLMPLCIRYWIAVGRTVLLDASGITVSFLRIKRTFSWDQVIQKRIFDGQRGWGYKCVSRGGIEFSSKPKPRPAFLAPPAYCFFCHPFSYVYFNFSLSPRLQAQQNPQNLPIEYAVDEEKIISVLESLGISLQR